MSTKESENSETSASETDKFSVQAKNTYVSVHNRSFISARKPSYAQKNYLCGFSDS